MSDFHLVAGVGRQQEREADHVVVALEEPAASLLVLTDRLGVRVDVVIRDETSHPFGESIGITAICEQPGFVGSQIVGNRRVVGDRGDHHRGVVGSDRAVGHGVERPWQLRQSAGPAGLLTCRALRDTSGGGALTDGVAGQHRGPGEITSLRRLGMGLELRR